MSESRLSARVRIAGLLACAGLTASMSYAQIVPGTQPGHTTPAQPQPGQPAFAEPEPNVGERPRTGREPSAIAEMSDAPALPDGADPEKPTFLVSAFVLRYAQDHPQLPAIDDLLSRQVRLAWRDGGYVEYTPGEEEAFVTIGDVAIKPPARFSSRALLTVARAVVDEINRYGIIGVTVSPSDAEFAAPEDGDPEWGKDVRRPGRNAVTLIIRTGVVTELRTIALGERFPGPDRIDNPAHGHIKRNAPVQVYEQDDPIRRDLLRRDLIERYVFRLNRHPGRRVDIAVSAAQQPGGIALDLLVNENKPWMIYGQFSNTGTESTNEWRQRFGFIHNQLTNRDDILSLDYITASFEDSHALIGSYDFPIFEDWLRLKPYASWNDFTASDVGFANERFLGNGYTLGMEISANVYQHRELFVDLFAGTRFQYVEIDNQVVDVKGDDQFFIPNAGVRMERITDVSQTNLEFSFEFNLPGVAGTDEDTLNRLGRINPDDDWLAFQWNFGQSLYLEPLLFSDWGDPQSPRATLAHEVYVGFRGQYAFDYRLIPNFQQVIGGLYTVRGYPESVVAGDTVLVGNFEYRFHLPQALGLDPNPSELFGRSFRWKPQQPYGRADWDLILRGFVDVGRVIQSERETFESDETLVGTGVGIEFAYRRNLSVRLDWGVALEELEGRVSQGSNRFHFVATLLY